MISSLQVILIKDRQLRQTEVKT